MLKTEKIYVAGHTGLIGSALVRILREQGYHHLVYQTHDELDLTDQEAVETFFSTEQPEYVFLAAAKVGGIIANQTYPADFLYQNLCIQNNVIHAAYKYTVKKLLFLGSSCIYPKHCSQPIQENMLLSGPLESTNEPYAIAKIAGIKLCQSYNRQYGTDFIACMPTNIYGPGDNFDLQTSHVIPALIHKFVKAKLTHTTAEPLRGDGSPRREFLYVDDLADACIFLMNHFMPTPEQNEQGALFCNIGRGEDISLVELADMIKEQVGYTGPIVRDTTKPNGAPRKLLDISLLNAYGRHPKTDLRTGLARTIQYFHDIYTP